MLWCRSIFHTHNHTTSVCKHESNVLVTRCGLKAHPCLQWLLAASVAQHKSACGKKLYQLSTIQSSEYMNGTNRRGATTLPALASPAIFSWGNRPSPTGRSSVDRSANENGDFRPRTDGSQSPGRGRSSLTCLLYKATNPGSRIRSIDACNTAAGAWGSGHESPSGEYMRRLCAGWC